jgi:proteasome accessory factor B
VTARTGKAKVAGGKAAATKTPSRAAPKAVRTRPAPPSGGAAAAADRDRGDRSKRLLDLVMLLLRARSPVTYREIREQFVAYQTANAEAGLRAFERDKADLLELGVPIRYLTPEEDDSLEDGGYVIDVKRYRMPEVRLTADEVSALVLAASVARAIPGGTYPKIVDLALKKLAFDLPEEPSDTPTDFPRPARPAERRPRDTVLVHFPETRPGTTAMADNVASLEPAIRFRKRVTFTYRAAGSGMTTKRTIDPYALAYRDGAWVVVGWCHLRQDVRSFRVDRISDAEMAPKPKSPDFERFDVRTYVSRSPWTFASESPELVELDIAVEAADTAAEDFGDGADKRSEGDRTIVRFSCTNPDYAASQVLKAKGAIVVRQGERLKKRIADELAAVAARYGEG